MRKQSEKKLARLREKAEELFWQHGFNGVSMDQIAQEAAISKMTIYKHFSSKENLLLEVLMDSTVYHVNKIMEAIKEKYHIFDKIEFVCTYSLELASRFPTVLAQDITERAHVMEKLVAFKQERMLVLWNYILTDGIEKGEIRALDTKFVSHLLLYLPGVLLKTDYLTNESKRCELLEKLFDFMKYGLLGGKEAFRI